METTTITEMIGKTYDSVTREGNDVIRFTDSTGHGIMLWHCQNCCEDVEIEDVCGDLDDLAGSPIITAEERSRRGDIGESSTWTFYEFATINGSVTIRWLGTSNGYYSESVDVDEF